MVKEPRSGWMGVLFECPVECSEFFFMRARVLAVDINGERVARCLSESNERDL
jgi:hypothetical protein